MKPNELVARGKQVLAMEADAITDVASRLDKGFAAAVALLVEARGRVIVSGVGKSGLIARKIAATLTSTGTAATFLHPTESLHGDLGIVGSDDVAILLSKSGESEEVLTLLAHLKRFGTKSIAVTGGMRSTLARESDTALDAGVREEACPHDLAPTTSTTAALALGDALAVAVLEQKGFAAADFARIHPGGSLGRKLLTRVSGIMERDRLPVVPPTASVRDVTLLLAARRGIVIVSPDGRQIDGVFTAGDLTRVLERPGDSLALRVQDVMTKTPRVAHEEELASAAVYRMEQSGIMAMPVLSQTEELVGVVHLHDLMRAGVA